MITWQDPVALGLALLLAGLATWWRRALIKRGEGPACSRCSAKDDAVKAPAKPTVIDVSRMRLGRPRVTR